MWVRCNEVVISFQQNHACLIQIQISKILDHHVIDQFCQRAGCFHAGRSAAYHDEGQHGAAFFCIRLAACLLEHLQ